MFELAEVSENGILRYECVTSSGLTCVNAWHFEITAFKLKSQGSGVVHSCATCALP